MTSSRRSEAMSMSMSGGPSRSGARNRSNSSWWPTGSTAVMPSAKQTAEFAADPRPWARIPSRAEGDDVVDDQEVAGKTQIGDDPQLVVDLRPCSWHLLGPLRRGARPVALTSLDLHQLDQPA